MSVRLLLVEDNRLLREGMKAMISQQSDFEVRASAGNGESVVAKVQEWKPQVLLLDLGLPSQNSLRVVELVKRRCPDVKVIVMDLVPSEADIVQFVKAGASGFLLKDATFEDFLRTIRSVAEGAAVLPAALTGSLFSQIIGRALSEGKPLPTESVRMTRREREIIELIADGLSNKEIAQRLNVATYTVKSHVHNILEKFALHSRVQLVPFVHPRARLREDPKIV